MDTTGQEYEARKTLEDLKKEKLQGLSDHDLKEELRRRGVVEEIIVDHSGPLSAFGKLPRAQQEQLRKALKREMGAAMGIGMIEKFKNHIWEEDRLITDVKIFHLKFEMLVK